MNEKTNSHHKMMIRDYKKRFFVSLIITVPTLLLSNTIQAWFNFNLTFYGKDYIKAQDEPEYYLMKALVTTIKGLTAVWPRKYLS